ncbi:50S ribosomal protein L29 [Candidatus Woesearchaeota archaeon]|nr:50S ribosomal protein L29 [Candidatus Woesearchaeota archaeon]
MNELKGLSVKDLGEKMVQLRKELMKINTQISTGTVPESPGKVKQIKKTIARIKMISHQKNNQSTRINEKNMEVISKKADE